MRTIHPFRKTLVARLILSLLLVSSLVTIVLTALQLFDDYRYEMSRVDSNFELLEHSSFDSLTKAIWNFDNSQIGTLLMGFVLVPAISYVELDVATGERYVAGVKPTASFQRRDVELFNERSRPESLATLHVYVSTESIYQRLFSKVLLLVCANAVKTLIVCSFMVIVIHRLITRHLIALVAETKQMAEGDWQQGDIDPSTAEAGGVDDDEIGLLRRHFRHMRNNLSAAFAQRERHLQQLEESKRVVEAASRAKNAFLANMSHELRTPLNAIIGFSCFLLLERKSFELRDDVADMVDRVHMAGQHLLRLIADLLDISMIEGGQIHIQKSKCDLCTIMREALVFQEAALTEKAIAVDFAMPSDFKIVCDGARLRQILNNLLANAVKFTPHGGRIILNGDMRENEALLYVIDSGIGIAPEHQKLIFEEFRQVDEGITRKYDGVGLGLSICHKLVQIMGGRIWVESVPGSGSTFGVALPLS